MSNWLNRLKPRTKVIGAIVGVLAIAGIGVGSYFAYNEISASNTANNITYNITVVNASAGDKVAIHYLKALGQDPIKVERNGKIETPWSKAVDVSNSSAKIVMPYPLEVNNVNFVEVFAYRGNYNNLDPSTYSNIVQIPAKDLDDVSSKNILLTLPPKTQPVVTDTESDPYVCMFFANDSTYTWQKKSEYEQLKNSGKNVSITTDESRCGPRPAPTTGEAQKPTSQAAAGATGEQLALTKKTDQEAEKKKTDDPSKLDASKFPSGNAGFTVALAVPSKIEPKGFTMAGGGKLSVQGCFANDVISADQAGAPAATKSDSNIFVRTYYEDKVTLNTDLTQVTVRLLTKQNQKCSDFGSSTRDGQLVANFSESNFKTCGDNTLNFEAQIKDSVKIQGTVTRGTDMLVTFLKYGDESWKAGSVSPFSGFPTNTGAQKGSKMNPSIAYAAEAAQINITGTVKNQDGTPAVGAAVQIKKYVSTNLSGSEIITNQPTNQNGKFSLSIPGTFQNSDMLILAMSGDSSLYARKIVPQVSNRDVGNLVLSSGASGSSGNSGDADLAIPPTLTEKQAGTQTEAAPTSPPPYSKGLKSDFKENAKEHKDVKKQGNYTNCESFTINFPDNGKNSTVVVGGIAEGIYKFTASKNGWESTSWWAKIAGPSNDLGMLPIIPTSASTVPPSITSGNIEKLTGYKEDIYKAKVDTCAQTGGVALFRSKYPWYGWQCAKEDEAKKTIDGYDTAKPNFKLSSGAYGLPVNDGSQQGFPNPNCYIATAVYGSGDDEKVRELRDFKDEYLLKSETGKNFVDLYYKISPPIANYIADKPIIKTAIKELQIDPLVWLIEHSK